MNAHIYHIKDNRSLQMAGLVALAFAGAVLATTPVAGAAGTRASSDRQLSIPSEFTEDFGGGTGFRYKVRNVQIENGGNQVRLHHGGRVKVSMEVLHNCDECGNAINQVIVGLAGEDRAQASVWNGKQRSGGEVRVVNSGTEVEAICEDNDGPAEWVKVRYDLTIPDQRGTYEIRTRYAQDYQGNLRTPQALDVASDQPTYEAPLGWWKVDRPNGPGQASTIGAVTVR